VTGADHVENASGEQRTALDALAVSGSTLTVWQLDRGSTVWAKAQTISVPIEPNSSS